jgi:diguanylate cyclase (GGDEF)-like protein/PAS domain S-box-containing protein
LTNMNFVRSNLLVVDGGPVRSSLLARRLRRRGYKVAEVAGKEQALDWILRQRVDLVLINSLPRFNGIEVLRAIRRDFTVSRLPVIMITGKKKSDFALQALKEGANDYVTKPVDFLVALARIQNHLALKQAEEALRDSEERYALAARGSIDGLWHWDLRTDRIQYSSRWKAMLGYQDAEIADGPDEWFGRVHAEDIELVRAELEAHLAGRTQHVEQEYRILHKDGSYRWMVVHGLAVRDASGQPYRVAGSQTDITRAKVADALTGLPNRVLFLDRLDRLVQKARRNHTRSFAVIFLDLDRFKLINDTLGHLAGDDVLITIARRLERSLRAGDTVARLGGDEFTALLDDINDPADAIKIAQRMSLEISRPIILGDQEVVATASMGISMSSSAYQTPEDLLKDADTAMYRAKMLGKNRIELFDPRFGAAKLANW